MFHILTYRYFLLLEDKGTKDKQDKDRRSSASSGNRNKPPRYRDDRRSGRGDRYDRYDNGRDGSSRHYSENRKRREEDKPSSRGDDISDKYDEPRPSSLSKSSNNNKDVDSPGQNEKHGGLASSSQKETSVTNKKDATIDKVREKELEQERYRRNWISKE